MNRRAHSWLTICLLSSLLAVARTSYGEDESLSQMPRVQPTAPANVGKSMHVLGGFTIDLIAHEPLVTGPVAAAYDPDGRAYVVEMIDYPYTDKSTDVANQERTTDRPIGRVHLLEDTDGDGKFDRSDVFAEGLSWATGIALYDGGAYVCGTPDIWYFKDTDGDRKADIRRKVFTGFRKYNVQAVINNLAWGLDGKIYGAGSSNGGEIRSLCLPKAKPVTLGRNDFCFDPRDEKFQLVSGGARFGNSFDDWGNRFVCNIRNPAQHVLLPARYLSRNPYLPVPSAIHDVAEAGDNVPVYRLSPSEPWRAIRAKRWAQDNSRPMPRSETIADGYFTSSSGITVYRGAAYPREYYENLFVAEVSANAVHRETMSDVGVTFAARRADPKSEFVRSTDNWFRPVNFVNAPDGTLHVLDMYRETIEHPWSIPDDIKAHLDLESGRDRGRMYRLSPPGFKVPKPPRLGKATTSELVATLENPNSWWRETAQRLLLERLDEAGIEPLRNLLRTSSVPLARLHAMYTLASLLEMRDDDLLVAMKDSVAGIREHAVLIAEPRLGKSPALAERVLALAVDSDIRVRFQVAFTLGEMAGTDQADQVDAAFVSLARRDAADEWMRIAILSSCRWYAGRMLPTLVDDVEFSGHEPGATFVRQLALVVGADDVKNTARRVRGILDRVAALPTSAEASNLQRNVVLGLGDGLKRSRRTFGDVLGNSAGSSLVRGLLKSSAKAALDPQAPLTTRQEAIEMLTFGPFADVQGTLGTLIGPRETQDVQMAAARALASFADAAVPRLLLAGYRSYTPALRSEVVELLLSRSDRIGALLDAVSAGLIAPGQISPARQALLMNSKDAGIRRHAANVLGQQKASPRKEVVLQYQSALKLVADKARGQKIFERECITCHRLGDKGHDVGPNLATIRHRSAEEVMTHVLDPNREVAPNFVQYIVTIDDGRVSTGIIANETATSITLKRAENVQETILRQNIEELASTGTSLMPEGMEKKIQPQEMADLLAYVLGK